MKYRKKWITYGIAATLILSTGTNGHAQAVQLLRTTQLHHYPSASAMEWHRRRLLLMGDDATDLLQLNKKHRKPHTVNIFNSSTPGRIPPAVKPDIEAGAKFKANGNAYLLLVPSFSAPKRKELVVLSLQGREAIKTAVISNPFPDSSGLAQVNIEGATQYGNGLLLANRGNFSAPQNHLLLARFSLSKGIEGWEKVVPIKLPTTRHFAGVSGLFYVAEKDLLLFTASTEITTSATADGEIGDSYLGVVKGFSQQLGQPQVTADTLINLTPILNSNTPQKIETIAVESIRGKAMRVHLAADNDNGQSTLFRLRINW